jgi:hypothetical protein
MSTALDDVILERVSFLREQLSAEDDPAFIRTFQAQIRTLETAQLGRLEELISIKRIDLEGCRIASEADRIFAELEALEWLLRQVQRRS